MDHTTFYGFPNLMETYLDNKRRLAALLATTTTAPAPPSSSAAKHPLFGPIPQYLLHKYLCLTPSNPKPKPILDYGRKHVPSTPLPAPPFSSSNDQQPVPMPPNQSPSFQGLICDIAPLIVTSNHDTQPPPPPPPPSFRYEHEPRSPILEESLRNFRCPVKNKSPVSEEHARMSRQKVSFFCKTQIGNDNVTDTIEEESPANVATDIDVEPHSQNDNINGHGSDPDIVLIQDDMPLLCRNSDQEMAEAANAAVGGASFRSDIGDSNRVHNVVIIEDDDEQPSLIEVSILNSNAEQEMVEADAIDDSTSGKKGVTYNCDTSTCILLTEDEPPSLEELSEWSALHGAGVCSCCVGAKSYESLGVETFGSPSMLEAKKVSVNCVSKKRNFGVVEPGSCVYSTRSKTKRRMDSSRLLSELKCLAASSPCPSYVAPFFTQFRAENWSFGDDSQLSSSDATSNKSLFALYGVFGEEI